MAVEFKFPWRLIDKSGNVVAENSSPYEDNQGDFYLQDDGSWLNPKTGVRVSGNIKYLDKEGKIVELDPDDAESLNNFKNKADNRAFGKIRSSVGTGVTPAFEQAVHSDKPKIENPSKPEQPSPGNNGVGSGGLIGEISKQNDILKNLVNKVSQKSGLNKISRSVSSLGKDIKSSLDKISSSIKENSGDSKVAGAIGSLKASLDKIATVKDDLVKISDNGKGLLDIEKERHEYEKKPQIIKDLDGQNVANLSPRDAQTVKNITQAKTATDTNNFELSEGDLDDLFGDLPDITGLFDIPYSSSVGLEYTK